MDESDGVLIKGSFTNTTPAPLKLPTTRRQIKYRLVAKQDNGKTGKGELESYRANIRLAAHKSPDDNRGLRGFCARLDDARVPIPKKWKKEWKVESWQAAYDGGNLQSAIRGVIRRYR